jgi:SPP1 family predicted phage head-tail adaptor
MVTTYRSDEAIVAMMNSNIALHSVTIRYRSDVKGSWRIKYTDRQGPHYWTIIGPPLDIGKEHKWLEIKVKETM